MTLTRPDCVIRIKDKDYYLVSGVAEMFSVDPRTVMRWLEDGKLTRVEYPNGICIPADEVETYFKARADGDRPQGAPPPGPKPSDGPGRHPHEDRI